MKSTKIWMAVAGVLFIILGIACICSPTETLFTLAWLIGIFTLFSGIAKLIFTFRTEGFLPNSGSRALSAVLQIILGCILLGHKIFVAISLPIIFALWVIVESATTAIQSFDYKRVGFPYWWCILLLGIGGTVMGILGLKNPDITAATLSVFIGIGIITIGCSYLVALRGINKFETKVDHFKKTIGIDEQ